ncbi:MAG: (Fe-S)-binding protein [Deltaproteobacteria bacterium]|nr:MAG: (Fe-S)-binding protein [Deltaproteobacteria bacterium]
MPDRVATEVTVSAESTAVDPARIKQMLNRHKAKIKISLRACVHCSLCAESCFLYTSHQQAPRYMPAYKFIHSTGLLYKKKGKVDRACLEKIRDIVWQDCVLCTRCYCVCGIDIPGLISLARGICRSQGVYPDFGVSGDG